MSEHTLTNAVLRFPKDRPKGLLNALTLLQDDAEEFSIDFDEYVSLILVAAVYGKLDGQGGSVYEQIDWKWMKENEICE
jgi:hypothetical protein